MAADVCKVGSFIFPLPPERQANVDDSREIAKVDIPGARPKYQDMGPGEKIISWNGQLVGESAMAYATGIQLQMHSGAILLYSHGPLRTYVRIRNFKKQVLRWDKVKYSIELVEDIPPVQEIKTTVTGPKVLSPKKANTPPKAAPLSKLSGKTFVMKQGDTLIGLQRKTGVSWQQIAKANHIINPRKIPVGKKIIIP
ncbi:LysM peptidoglycan-binding domain-containing protein [Aneurinibacillus sp. Ricciae_BoGa-3]|uniref:LysM peptidoglycan-binding domain-containing protein n=1 Tax=Aneurinibacillus sp. Ricciae_BoGa-3 TaxID=3022697 RepID=UPI002341E822|nr:LysM peptidoglycan-binding domain-containing protein [Aneurinibacillus sp. Ricciae_BoGa-3]WCK55435.1 LysM peptidoglycan-binding domain-containing protein [Aneurinibacillus sp. Ricciae_BoGa-3]